MAATEPTSANRQTTSHATNALPLAPFHHLAFAVLWVATVVSNVGTWMQNAAAGWLMTGLNPDPFVVSLVQVAGSLPMFLFALPAGALADIVDRRRLLIAIQIASTLLVGAFTVLVWRGQVNAEILLGFSFLAATAAALIMPAWQAVVPQLVPREHLQPAVALNSVGLNVSRAIGPALAGLLIATLGIAAPFGVNALSTLGVIAALIWWRPTQESTARHFPAEHFWRAIGVGLRHAHYNVHLRATLIRAAGFFLFASSYWALLPLLARQQVAGGPELYGLLLGAIGTGAVGGAFLLPWLKKQLGADGLAVAGTLGTALALLLFALAQEPIAALAACLIAGLAWIAVLATLNVSAQVALPPWVRGRGLSIYGTVMFGALTLGSTRSRPGPVCRPLISPPLSVCSRPYRCSGAGSCRPLPISISRPPCTGRSRSCPPILPRNVARFWSPSSTASNPATALRSWKRSRLADERRRDGAFQWEVFEDAARESCFVETFMLDSWIEHLRQHERVTQADRQAQERVNRFHRDGAPKVTHLIAAP